MSARSYDIVLFGATGFTGGLTAEYLAEHAPAELRWAIAGRNHSKLEALRAKLLALDGACREVGIVIASVDDESSLARMAASTRVLLTTVGPFIDYGEPVVRACIAAGTDYVDSTGEPSFWQLLLSRYDAQARTQGVRVVPSCGFDSIPADLGVLFTVLQLPSDQPIEITGYMRFKALFSGGTHRSALKTLLPPKVAIPVAPTLVPIHQRRVRLLTGTIARRPELGGWVSPLPTVDGPIVARSAASDDRYGPDFSYAHHVVHGPFAAMLTIGLFFGIAALLMRVPFVASFVLSRLQPPGQGPSAEQRAKSWFKLKLVARCAGKVLRTEVSGGDPGYGETSKMLAESVLCLALDRGKLPSRTGVLTSAEAMGEALLLRVQRAGVQFRTL